MFKMCCGNCGECWYIGNPRTCKCPDETKQEPVAWAKRAAEWLLDLPNTRYDAPYFTNGMFKGDCLELADLLQNLNHPQPKREWVDLTSEEILLLSRYDLEYAALIGEVRRKLKEKNA